MTVEQQVWHWVDEVVIGLNLCPFAKKPRINQQIKVFISEAKDDNDLVNEFMQELEWIKQVDPNNTDTSLFVIPYALFDFEDYLDFLSLANILLQQLGLEGQFQLASFHPNYQFDGTEIQDQENLTNTAPFPIIHIIREATVERVLKVYPNPELIPDNNIERVLALTEQEIQQLYPFIPID